MNWASDCISTSDTGSQYRCGRVGRDVRSPSTPQSPHTPKHTQKVFKNTHFPTFQLVLMDVPIDGRTDGRTKPLIELCVRNKKSINAHFPTFWLDHYWWMDRRTDQQTEKASYRVACPQQKNRRIPFIFASSYSQQMKYQFPYRLRFEQTINRRSVD